MRRVRIPLSLSVAVVLFASLTHPRPAFPGGSGAASPPVLVVTSVTATDLVGDPLVTAPAAESLFVRVLGLPGFEEVDPATTGGQGTALGFQMVPNPFRVALHGAAGDPGLGVELELEMASYERLIGANVDRAFLDSRGARLPGPTFQALVVGEVQWRATVRGGPFDTATVLLGRGVCIGKLQELGRREALERANKRALYDLACAMTDFANKNAALHLAKKRVRDGWTESLARSDDW